MLKPLTAALAALALATSPALAQPPAPAGKLDAATREAAVRHAAKLLRERYVFPEVGDRAAQALETRLAAGGYEALDDRQAFAAQLTSDLADVTHDKHLRVRPAGGGPPPNVAPPPRSEGGVVRADRLPGNIGYLEISGFPPLAIFKSPVDRAMSALADSKGLIIDVRRNGGGNPDAVAYLASYFIDSDKPLHMLDFVDRVAGTQTFRTQAVYSVATPAKYVKRPVYVLTSGDTFSGGEGFAYDMKVFKLGTVVGETTGGGANPGGVMPLPGGFGIFLPGGRPVNAVTKTNWEGVGVIPDVPTSRAEALRTALQKLGQQASAGDVDSLSQARLFQPRTTPQPGAEAVLRRMIEALAKGEPNYADMGEDMAAATRAQFAGLKANMDRLGPLQSLSFREVDPQGGNVYDVKFANGALQWRLTLGSDGKVIGSNFRPL